MTLLLPSLSVALAATISVPGDFANLDDAIEEAAPGDTIEVDAGTYRSTLAIDKDLTLLGVAGSGSTTLANTGLDDVLTILAGATVVIEGFTFDPSVAGRAIDLTEGTLTLRDAIVRGNGVTDRPGAALRARTDTVLTVEDSIFDDNDANGQNGGHLYAEGATVTLIRTLLDSGAADEGGAIWASSTRLTLEDCEVRTNSSGGGGALSLSGSTLTATGTLFEGNEATGDWSDPNGGAILMANGSIATLEDCTVEGNLTDNRGGAIDVDDGDLTVVRGTFEANLAAYGGAVYVDSGTLTTTDATFTSNQATAGGGAIRFRSDGGSMTLAGSSFVGNTSEGAGGAIGVLTLAGLATMDVQSCRFDENIAGGNGGALDVADVDGSFVGNRFCLNQAVDGAGVRIAGAGGLWTNNRFQHNAATGNGGGIRVVADGSVDVFNNTFVANRAIDGGALSATSARVGFVNNAVAFQGEGGGVSADNVAGDLTYSLFWQNLPADLSPNLAAVVGPDVLFEEPGFTRFTDDLDCNDDELWPMAGSPLIDRGDPSVLDVDGTPSDIGAYGGPSAEALPGEDGDGDGYGEGVDCDDDDPAVNPGAEEDCTSVDRDCSGDPYDAPTGGTWFVDSDGDGFGVDGDTVVGCEPPPGYAPTNDDCDDGDPDVNPSAMERCNGIDDDCNGQVDDGVVDAWYVDADGDGFGTGAPLDQCDPSADLVSVDGDCDDGDADVFPGADEIDGDGIDSDCDGFDGSTPPIEEPIVAQGACGCRHGRAAGWLGLPIVLAWRRRAQPR